MALPKRRQRAGAHVSDQALSTERTVEGICGRESAVHLGMVALRAQRIPQVCVEGGAGVNEVELCPEGLLPAFGV